MQNAFFPGGQDKDMGRKAVDVVLLPDDAMADRAIEANAQLVEKFGSKIVLNKTDCLPHISLAMGCIDQRDVAAVGEILQSITKQHPLGDLKVIGIAVSTNSVGEKVSVFTLEKTEKLQSLHQMVMKELSPYLGYDVAGDMVADAEVAESTLLWIENYRAKSSFANFSPHITIGYGQVENLSSPVRFTTSKLAVCHLGNHCTCRKVLVSIPL